MSTKLRIYLVITTQKKSWKKYNRLVSKGYVAMARPASIGGHPSQITTTTKRKAEDKKQVFKKIV